MLHPLRSAPLLGMLTTNRCWSPASWTQIYSLLIYWCVCKCLIPLYNIIWLVAWNIFIFSIYWEFHHPNWLFFFRGVGQPPTSIKWCFHMASIRVTLGDLVGRGSPIWWWLSKRGARCGHNWHIKWIRSVLRQGWCNDALEGSWKPMKTP